MTTLADLIAEVAAEHHADGTGGRIRCWSCGEVWGEHGCNAARLAAALSVENVAAGLHAAMFPECHKDHTGTPRLAADLRDAAALLAAMTVAG